MNRANTNAQETDYPCVGTSLAISRQIEANRLH